MKISDQGLQLIKDSEGCKLTAYFDVVGVLTIGYGSTLNVNKGETITQEEAEALLIADIQRICEPCIEAYVDVALTQGQYDALTSFIFNLGCKAFRGSTLRKMLNDGDYHGASWQFNRWIHAGGKVLPGLAARRSKESAMFSGKA